MPFGRRSSREKRAYLGKRGRPFATVMQTTALRYLSASVTGVYPSDDLDFGDKLAVVRAAAASRPVMPCRLTLSDA